MDARAQRARSYHQQATEEADIYREQRDLLVRELRNEDPVKWSYSRLAREVGCSKARIKQILEA